MRSSRRMRTRGSHVFLAPYERYDKDQVPDAAHFFASCALGFGAKDEALSSIKASHEAAVYLGRLRGGEPLKETAPTAMLTGASTAF